MISVDEILFFIQVAKCTSFKQAADNLFHTQATVSRRIQALEKKLALELFKRNYRCLELSQSGQELFQRFATLEQSLAAKLQKIHKEHNDLSGTLRVGIASNSLNSLILPQIHLFTETNPRAKIIIKVLHKSVELINDKLDLAISPDIVSTQNATVKLMFRTRLKLYAHPHYAKLFGLPQTLLELEKHRVIKIFDGESQPIEYFTASNLATNETEIINIKGSFYVRDSLMNNFMDQAGHYIAFAIPEFVRSEVKQDRLLEVLPEYSFRDLNFYLLRGNLIRSNLEREFVKFLEQCFVGIGLDVKNSGA